MGAPNKSSTVSAGHSAVSTKADSQPAVTPSAKHDVEGRTNNVPLPMGARRAEPLDLGTVQRRGNHTAAKHSPKRDRCHGIPDAPTYRPTEEEFRDPSAYIRKIAPEARRYGIAKIVPPETWKPDFAIDTTRFHFRTRRQELNSVEGGNRSNLNYLDQLAKFHRQHGTNLTRFPSVDKRPLDLYKLKKAVDARGGFEAVCKVKKWAEIGRDLGYSGKIMSSLSTSLKNSYQRWLHPYEEYLRIAKPGVQTQLEREHGGPYTPPLTTSPHVTPPSTHPNQTTHAPLQPTMAASAALNGTLFESATAQTSERPGSPSHNGFTAVNAKSYSAAEVVQTGFTAINGSTTKIDESMALDPNANAPAEGHGNPSSTNASNQLKRPHSLSTGQHTEHSEPDRGRKVKKQKTEAVPTVVGSNMHQTHVNIARPPALHDRILEKPDEVCENCGKPDSVGRLLACEACESLYHTACLEPEVTTDGEHDWFCPRCLVGTGDFGFQQGETYSLREFQDKARQFKDSHFARRSQQDLDQSKPIAVAKSEDDIEREFWRLVEDVSETVEVEYGADIHSTTHGSGFATFEKHPRDPYSAHPWNLNVLPLYGDSLFKHIGTDISGMTVPWLYVGMVFSTFCWHNEDHYTYSANYQHFGDTKTWYGVPGEDAEKFEAAMKDAVPELFECQPDLLFQLVTLLPPAKLRQAGVGVYALDQRAGEFVITFPQAYHAGFNHGFNFNEAVNFAPPDWEPFGAADISRLQMYRRQPCFSHDELLLTAAARDNTITTADWLGPALVRMLDRERQLRAHFIEQPMETSEPTNSYRGSRYTATPQRTSDNDEQHFCCVCKASCYLSTYICKTSGDVMCLHHAGNHHCCEEDEQARYSNAQTHTLYFRSTGADLDATVQRIVDRARVPQAWIDRVETLLRDDPKPPIKTLRSLLHEAERIPFDFPQLPDLKKFVSRCNDWIEEASTCIMRKPNRRKSEKAGRKSFAKTAESDEQISQFRRVDNIQKLLAEADDLCFSCPEIDVLRERADGITKFQCDVRDALNAHPFDEIHRYEELCEVGRTFGVDIPEIDMLEQLVEQIKWRAEAESKRGKPSPMSAISAFIERGIRLGLPETDPDRVYLSKYKLQGETWETAAREALSKPDVLPENLEMLYKQIDHIPVNEETVNLVHTRVKAHREAREKIISLYEQSKDPDFRKRPMYKEVKELMEKLEDINNKPDGTADLEKELRKHEDWMRRGKKLFGKTNAPLPILHQHMIIVKERNDGCFELRDKPRMPVEPSSRQHTPEETTADDIHQGEKPFPDVFCVCRKPEAGMMIECELCHEWYHGRCLKIARGKVKENDKYTCPICDWRLKIPRDAARPKLEELQNWHSEIEALPFQPEEEQTLFDTIDTAENFRDYIRPFLNPLTVTPEEVSTLRFYLRKVEGADLLLSEETNFLRQEMHKWAPVAPIAPPIIEQSGSTRKARPTKIQKIMTRLGITDPEELPEEHKPKQPAKRKTFDLANAERRRQSTQQVSNVSSNNATPTTSAPPQEVIDTHDSRFSFGSQAEASTAEIPTSPPLFGRASVFAEQHVPHGMRESATFEHHDQPTLEDGPSIPRGTANLDPALFGMDRTTAYDKVLEVPNHDGQDTLFDDMVYPMEQTSPEQRVSNSLGAGSGEGVIDAEDVTMDEFVNSQ